MLPVLVLAAFLNSPAPTVLQSTPPPVPTPVPVAGESQSPQPTRELATLLAEAEARFARRSIGAINEVANPAEVDAAIALYRQALARSPRDIAILARLMRAMHFRGAFTGAGIE